MSTRWYPLYQKGNPQLRVFLPNFWMKLVKPEADLPKYVVQFHCSMEMTRHDVKNYLEKIYKVPVVKVNTRIALGKTKKSPFNYVVKEDDVKIAYVHLPRYESFVFPDMFNSDAKIKERETEDKAHDEIQKDFKAMIAEHNKRRPGLPPWFTQ